MKYTWTWILAILPLFADDEFSDMSLEELLQIEVNVASKKSEDLFDAPGVVSIITGREIKDFGAMNLGELLERAPGIFGISSFILPQNGISVRGDYPGHTSAHVLYLIDGRPVRGSLVGGFIADILTSFPVSAIDRVEIIRGPGSVLYGSNAFAGVVNIITRKGEERGVTLFGGGGSDDAGYGGFSADTTIGGLTISSDFFRFEDEGWMFQSFLSPGNEVQQSYSEDIISGRVSLDYKDLSFTGYYAQNYQNNITSATFPAVSRNQRIFFDLGYQKEVNEYWAMSLNATFNQIRNILPNGPNIPAYPESQDVVVETTHNFDISDRLKLTAGASMYFLSGDWTFLGNFVIPEYNQEWWNAYFQMDYQATDRLKLIAGGQLNKPEDLDTDFVPRVGAIMNFNEKWGGKLLYGEAFRAAFPGETQIAIQGTLRGTAGLVPETIATIDAQLFYDGDNSQFTLTYFDSEQEELITRIPSPSPDFRLEFANKGFLNSSGYEFEGKYIPRSNLFFTGSFSHFESENDTGVENSSLVPENLAKIGVTWSGSNGFSLGVFNAYASGIGQVRSINPNVAEVNPEPESFSNLTAKITWSPQIPGGKLKRFSWSLYGSNLLDEEIIYPEFLFRRVNSIDGRADRTLYTTLNVSF